MVNLRDIMSGHLNELMNKNELLEEQRINICRNCPLYKETVLGPICNNKWLDLDTGEVFENRIDNKNMIKGCKCRLESKTRLEKAKCPASYW